MYPIQNSMYSLSNTILSGYTQMNQMRAMLAASGNSKLSAIRMSPVRRQTSLMRTARRSSRTIRNK